MKRGFAVMLLSLQVMACSQQDAETPERRSLFDSVAPSPVMQASSAYSTPLTLPADHRSHDDYQLEWWYLTVVAADKNDTPYGIQFTLFRFRQDDVPDNAWSNQQLWMGHVSVHTTDNHWFEEKLARGGVGNAGVTTGPFVAFIDNWRWQAADQNQLFPSTLSIALNDDTSITLTMTDNGQAVKHGNDGLSRKTADGRFRSYYYSQPFIKVSGLLTTQDDKTEISGQGWFDHEWSSALADQDALGWDWLSLHLDDGQKLMAFRMHTSDPRPYVTGTLVDANGQSRQLDASDITMEPIEIETLEGRALPVRWQVQVPVAGIDITVFPFKQGQWNDGLFPYYEGRVDGTGTHTASGFLELTGYQ